MHEGAVCRLFLRAWDLAPENRPAFLDTSSAPAHVRGAVIDLLRYDDGSEAFLQRAVSCVRPGATSTNASAPNSSARSLDVEFRELMAYPLIGDHRWI